MKFPLSTSIKFLPQPLRFNIFPIIPYLLPLMVCTHHQLPVSNVHTNSQPPFPFHIHCNDRFCHCLIILPILVFKPRSYAMWSRVMRGRRGYGKHKERVLLFSDSIQRSKRRENLAQSWTAACQGYTKHNSAAQTFRLTPQTFKAILGYLLKLAHLWHLLEQIVSLSGKRGSFYHMTSGSMFANSDSSALSSRNLCHKGVWLLWVSESVT